MPERRVFMITGAAGGIGTAIATQAIQSGAHVVLFDRDPKLEAVVQELGPGAVGVRGDVSNLGDQQRAVQLALSQFGRLDAIMANAGIEGTVAPLVDQTPEDFQRVLSVDVLGAFNSIKAAAPVMVAGGSIVITSSVAGVVGTAGLGPYVTSKHAVVGLMRTAALELAARSIRVNTVHPGPIDNRMMRSIEEGAAPGHGSEVKSAFLSQIPLGRYGTNDEIATLILWLCSDASSYCTGQRFIADGGFLCQ